ncbi:hypothetical protein CH375_08230 [Leptospira ellisii]|uniref:Uncharacterized protein n=1 Tax=Leptospira ellisii TaxID=2023197 RepID=A0A2N0BLK7_9LEPT|nr:hypothetical protein CH379_08195 [Leptospira ellisii]PKA04902.1 hypothetical protein CH375_08230 [Leptospira ellisii]
MKNDTAKRPLNSGPVSFFDFGNADRASPYPQNCKTSSAFLCVQDWILNTERFILRRGYPAGSAGTILRKTRPDRKFEIALISTQVAPIRIPQGREKRKSPGSR